MSKFQTNCVVRRIRQMLQLWSRFSLPYKSIKNHVQLAMVRFCLESLTGTIIPKRPFTSAQLNTSNFCSPWKKIDFFDHVQPSPCTPRKKIVPLQKICQSCHKHWLSGYRPSCALQFPLHRRFYLKENKLGHMSKEPQCLTASVSK